MGVGVEGTDFRHLPSAHAAHEITDRSACPHHGAMRKFHHHHWRNQDDAVGRSEEHTSEIQSPMRDSYPTLCLNKKPTFTCNTVLRGTELLAPPPANTTPLATTHT